MGNRGRENDGWGGCCGSRILYIVWSGVEERRREGILVTQDLGACGSKAAGGRDERPRDDGSEQLHCLINNATSIFDVADASIVPAPYYRRATLHYQL